jgi:drug/metabolite transporter (DMT)-like permease
LFYFVTCSVIWGLTWIAIGYQFHSLDSSAAVFYRFLAASLVLFGYVKLKNLPLKFAKSIHLNFLAQGFFMFCLNYQITYWAAHLAPSALLALAFTALVHFNMIGGRLFFKTPMQKEVILGACVGFLGMALISYNELLGKDLNPTSLYGFLLGLVSTLSASAGNLISSQSRKMKVPIASNNAWSMLYGGVFTFIYCLFAQRSFAVSNVDTSFILSFLYLTIFGTVISFGAYLKLIDLMGPSKAAFTSIVSPVIAIGVSMVFENFRMTWLLAGGILLCLLGIIVALNPRYLLREKPDAY